MLSPGLSHQFSFKVFAKRIEVNILYFSVNQMIMTTFCDSFCLADSDPVGGLVAGTLSALLDKGFQQVKGVMIDCHPVIGD